MFLHQDWLGNDRIVSATTLHTVSADRAYAPYGEQYDTFGSTNPIFGMFAGITGDFDSGVLLDAPNRELAQYQGRWLSPDPAGTGWNQYAYPTNPNSQIDPSGLECLIDCDDPGGWGFGGGGSGFGGMDGLSGNSCDPTDDPNCILSPITPPGGLPGPVGGSRSAGSGTVGGSSILPGEDCVACYSLGPSPEQILQAILSGNVLGALQGIGVFPGNGCDFGAVCTPMGSGFTPYTGPPPDPQSLQMTQFLLYLGNVGFPDYGPPILPSNPYLVPGTQCSAGCHPEPPNKAPDVFTNCQKLGIVTTMGGWMAGPWFEGAAGWLAYAGANAVSTATLLGCF